MTQSKGTFVTTRKEIADRVVAKWAERGMAIERDAEVEVLLKLRFTGDVPIDCIRRRYLKLQNAGQGARSIESPWRTKPNAEREATLMGYDWNGRRERRMKIARFGTAVALAALLVSMAAKVASEAL